MEGRMLGFVIWCAVGGGFLCLALYSWFSKRPVGFWANARLFEVRDVKGYNRAMAKLFGCFGLVFLGLGIPLLESGSQVWILLSVVGVMAESIGAMVVYSLVIERKYRK
ncbi:MAG: hypothetical protein HFG75_04680 [Hungatella sp.]|nr:hypothetical protein [Hungatella sp.]